VSGQRIDPGGRKEIGLPLWLFARAGGLVSRTNPPNLFTTLGRNRGLFRGWLSFARKLMPFGKLPRRESEIVILRVAHLRGSEYEWKHHLRLGRRAGLGDSDFERIKTGPGAGGWSPRELAILNAVEDLHEGQDISDQNWTELTRFLDDKEAIELVMLAAHYEMLATVIHTLRIQPDA